MIGALLLAAAVAEARDGRCCGETKKWQSDKCTLCPAKLWQTCPSGYELVGEKGCGFGGLGCTMECANTCPELDKGCGCGKGVECHDDLPKDPTCCSHSYMEDCVACPPSLYTSCKDNYEEDGVAFGCGPIRLGCQLKCTNKCLSHDHGCGCGKGQDCLPTPEPSHEPTVPEAVDTAAPSGTPTFSPTLTPSLVKSWIPTIEESEIPTDFELFQAWCAGSSYAEECKGCAGKFKGGKCKPPKKAKKVKCKKVSKTVCLALGCDFNEKKSKCTGKPAFD